MLGKCLALAVPTLLLRSTPPAARRERRRNRRERALRRVSVGRVLSRRLGTMRALTLSLAVLFVMSLGSAASAAVVFRAGPVRVAVGRRYVAPAPAVRARRAPIRHGVPDNRGAALNNPADSG